MRDPYQVLGIDRGANADDVKAAFRRLAQKYHPDRNPDDAGAHERFKELNTAYQILGDPDKRARFDRFGAAGIRDGVGGVGFGGFNVNDLGAVDLEGIFGDFLRGFGVRGPQEQGNLRHELRITFEEAAFGCEKEITYERVEACDTCHGSGAASTNATVRCDTCGGRGRVRQEQGLFPIAIERPCPSCGGSGKKITDPCKACRGAGLLNAKHTIEVSIPGGIEPDSSRIVERAGNMTRPERPPGDLELIVKVLPHPVFRRAGDDIVCTLSIPFVQAALGAEVDVTTLDGRGTLRVPAGTQPGAVLRIKGKGIPRRGRGGRGDQLVDIEVNVPTNLTARQRELFESLAREMGTEFSTREKGFVEKLKELFE